MKPPFTTDDMIGAVPGTFSLPENVARVRSQVRASGAANCARNILYYMQNQPVTNLGEPEDELTAEQGRMAEDLSIAVINHMGYEVIHRQTCIGHTVCSDKHAQARIDLPFTGHPDGELVTTDGFKWGFEHKHMGRYKYTKILKQGIVGGTPDYLIQALLYGYAMDWDAVQFVVTSQDGSAIRGDMTNNLKAKNPEHRWANAGHNKKIYVESIDLRPYKSTLLPVVLQRILWLNQGYRPEDVAPEAKPWELSKKSYYVEDGEVRSKNVPDFPCSYCNWYDRCLSDLEETEPTLVAPMVPL